MNAKPFVLIPLVTALVACGGSDSETSATTSGGSTVSVLITDNLSQNYNEVWVDVYSVRAIDADGRKVTLFEDATGRTFNLSQLVNIGALVDAQTVAPGTYTSFEVVLGNAVTLVDGSGNLSNAVFDQGGGSTYTIVIEGNLVVDPNRASTLALDFDLANFTYDPTTGIVTPVVIQKDPDALAQAIANMRGEVRSVDAPDRFVLSPGNGRAAITVKLHDNAVVVDPVSGSIMSDTSPLQAGMDVRVSGAYDADTLTIVATNVVLERHTAQVVLRHEVEGYVTAVNGTVIELDVDEATFRPGSNVLSIDVGNALFSKGALAMLASGQKVEVKGDWDGTTFNAAVVEIEGAPRSIGNHSYDDDYAEIEGIVTNVTGDTVTLTVREYEHVNGVSVGQSVTVDRSGAWYKHGDASCLAPGMEIEIKGAFAADAMKAFVIEYDDHSCYGAYGGGKYAEIEGSVTEVTDTTVVLTVQEYEHVSGITRGQSVTVRRGDAWYKDGDVSCLVPGTRIEVKGSYDGTALNAFTIEFEDGSCYGTSGSSGYAEVEGTVTAVTGDTVTLTVHEYEHVSGILVGQNITVNRSDARFEDGDASCLAPGVRIEVEGNHDGTVMHARVIEFEGDHYCGRDD